MSIDFPTWFDRVKSILIRDGVFASDSDAIHEMANYADDLRGEYDAGVSPREAADAFASL